MSNLQTIARRCPIMGKALAIQSVKSNKIGLAAVAGLGAVRSIHNKVSEGKARLHTSRPHEARAVDDSLFGRDKGMCLYVVEIYPTSLTTIRSPLQSTKARPPTSHSAQRQIQL
jgi:hypothetical protein